MAKAGRVTRPERQNGSGPARTDVDDRAAATMWLGLVTPDELDPATFDQDAVNEALPGRVLVKA